MEPVRVIEVKESVFEDNNRDAEALRAQLKAEKTFLLNLMSSPGSGKTSTLLALTQHLQGKLRFGVMEADIEATVDAEKMAAAGVRSMQIHTGGECCMDAAMTQAAINEFDTEDLDIVFLENVGNLVCTAEQDTGANINIEILSVPEGDDKPLKYPLMFTVTQAVLVNKTDTRKFFAFDDEAFVERVHALNPLSEVFFVSAKTGEGFDAWISWLRRQVELSKAI